MKKIFLILYSSFFIFNFSFSQNVEVYPSNWWVGMKWNKVQLMLHAPGIGSTKSVKLPEGIHSLKFNSVENPNYLFLDLKIPDNAKPGKYSFSLYDSANEDPDNPSFQFDFELKPRRSGNGTTFAQGVRSQDLMYLIMPDRFANGDYNNDKVPGMRDQSLNRDSLQLRHGGDLQGVIDHLDYLEDLGITAVWLTPVMENDMPRRTEHGYAMTNQYKVDPRLGSNELYKKLGDELHKRGMKLVQDAVYNHMGSYNFTFLDPPMKEWVHQWPAYTQTNYKDQPLFDPHASEEDRTKMVDGWFTREMPDMNQSNPYVANFLIQQAIWSVEEFGVDGWRIDTYIYCDLDFMNRCNKALMDEYPRITMFGECWVTGTANEAYFVQNNLNSKFKTNLVGVTDFQWIFNGIYPAIKEGKNDNLYEVLSNDFLYKDPMNNVIFLDNHDITRFYSEVGEDFDKLKMGLGCLLTSRGIPEMYYGTEVLMTGAKGGRQFDLNVRKDFPGGWKEDAQNKFTTGGRTEKENEIFNWTKTIANFRKNSSAIKTGKLTQYAPQNGVYVYFRYDDKQTVMTVMNTSDKERTIDTKRFVERTNGFSKARNIVTTSTNDLNGEWKIPAKTIWIMELQK
jgi:glycosidase